MPRKKPLVYPVVFIILLTALFTFLLAFINASTIDEIERQEELSIQRSILYIFDIPYKELDDRDITKRYTQNISSSIEKNRKIYRYTLNDTVKGYAFEFSGSGLWGTISGHIAFTPSFDQILGVNFIRHSETPGLGGRIDEVTYKDQFRNISVMTANPLIYRPATNGNIDSISGATLTSKAVKDIINDFIPKIKSYAKEVGLYE